MFWHEFSNQYSKNDSNQKKLGFFDFKPKKELFNIKNISQLEKVTNIFFSNKRKMINKNIKKILDNDQINLIHGLNLNLRPSDLKPEVYYKITELFEQD